MVKEDSNKETPEENTSPESEKIGISNNDPESVEDHYDPNEVWKRSKSPLLTSLGVLALAVGGYSFFQNSQKEDEAQRSICLLYTSTSPRDQRGSRMPSSA